MNIQEMHIAVSQGVDKIHSFQADVLLPEEIDLELNKNIHRFISQRFNTKGNKYGTGFEQSQKRIDDLRSLLTEANLVPIYKETVLSNSIYIDTVEFPQDYYHLIRVSSRSRYYKCKPLALKLKENQQIQYFPIGINKIYNNGIAVNSLQLVLDYVTAPNAESNVDILTSINDLPTFDTQDAFIAYITDPINTASGITVYYESHETLYHPSSLLFVIDPVVYEDFSDGLDILGSVAIVADIETLEGGLSTSVSYGTESETVYTRVRDEEVQPNSFSKGIYSAKFAQHDDIYKMLADPFNKTKHTAPLYTIRDNKLELYSNAIFIIDRVKMLYIRKPAKVSLTLQVNCDLPDNVHQEIVDMTVATILGNISDPRYQIGSVERLQSE